MAEEDQEDQEQPLPAAVAVEAAQDKPNQLVCKAGDDREITKGSSLSLKLKIPITKPPSAAAAEAGDHQFMEEDLLLLQREQEQDQQDCGRVLGLVRTCSECGKQFTSGKALGGHKRACLQKIKNGSTHNNQNPRLSKNAVALKLEEAGEESNINDHMCYVCHQSFRSVKSLYGHMRKHPEREWRGVQPPKHYLLNHRPQHPSPPSSPTIHYRLSRDNHDHDHYDDDGYDVDGSMGSGAEDLVESLKGWSAKRKRGQRLTLSSSSDEDEEEEEAMRQAVSDLLLLAQLSADDCNDNKEQRGTFDDHRVVSSVGSGYGVLKIKDNKKIDDDHDEDDDKEKKKVNVEMKDGNGLGFDNCTSEDTWFVKEDYEGDEYAGSSETDDQTMATMMMKQQKKNKRRRLNELDDAVLEGASGGRGALKEKPVVMSTAQTYSCPICDKSFDKHQALGGHVASHNKNKNVKESSSASATAAAEDSKGEDKLAAAAASDEETGESSRELAAAAAAAVGGSSEHRCNICDKIFPTGQALGGHKRCHWTGPPEAFSSSSQVTTSTCEVTQGAPSPGRVVHDFDLNDTPPEYYQFHGGEAAAPSAAAATIS